MCGGGEGGYAAACVCGGGAEEWGESVLRPARELEGSVITQLCKMWLMLPSTHARCGSCCHRPTLMLPSTHACMPPTNRHQHALCSLPCTPPPPPSPPPPFVVYPGPPPPSPPRPSPPSQLPASHLLGQGRILAHHICRRLGHVLVNERPGSGSRFRRGGGGRRNTALV